ncbi:hypothetical protein SCLCIDRAFT_1088969 [Scleroderma citrinum Foug A]|uniref:Uncharacterized protein n=1 Tax=Scleroderma citrinum Foug A TaxID=1036808 RepID=A0A0C3A1B7_9AGAM|nr:hypothetical protein SCLCIDRAFT_1088969 [Scleroderma citrinum Foug A]
MATLTAKPHLKHLLHASASGDLPKEDIIYALICEFLLQHKVPHDRFLLFPQISLRWKPNQPSDLRAEIADFGIGNVSLQKPYFKLRVGAEAKRSVHEVMRTLPPPSTIEDNEDVKAAFHLAFFQGEDQAKAVIKGGVAHSAAIQYLIFIGPYWTPVTYGPFTPIQLEIRTHKPSDSGDFVESLRAARRLARTPARRTLYLLGTQESEVQLEYIFSTTDAAAEPLRNEAKAYTCMFTQLHGSTTPIQRIEQKLHH